MKKTFLLFIFLIIFVDVKTQEKKQGTIYGLGGIFNFQTEGKGLDLRAIVPLLKNKIFITPRISYYIPSNKINEYYAGFDINYYPVAQYKNFYPYIFVGGYYNNWINSSDFSSKKAKQNNLVPEGGIGLIYGFGCIDPFAEWRYDAHWKEGSIIVGILFHYNKCFNSVARKAKKCAKF